MRHVGIRATGSIGHIELQASDHPFGRPVLRLPVKHNPTPKVGKPTKAEKKAAKKARQRARSQE